MARHLVMAGRLIDEDPELAYEHAQAAVRRAGRVDVVREAAALTAYRTGRYAEALRELRTVRRLNGSDEHMALMADCERGLGRPDRALALAQEDAVRDLPAETQVELAIVVSGARLDLGDPDAALAALGTAVVRGASGELAERVVEARAGALEAAGRSDEARALLAGLPGGGEVDEEIVVFDLEDEDEEDGDGPSTSLDDVNSDGPVTPAAEDAGRSAQPVAPTSWGPEGETASDDRQAGVDAWAEADAEADEVRAEDETHDEVAADEAAADDDGEAEAEAEADDEVDVDTAAGPSTKNGDEGDAHGGTLF